MIPVLLGRPGLSLLLRLVVVLLQFTHVLTHRRLLLNRLLALLIERGRLALKLSQIRADAHGLSQRIQDGVNDRGIG